MNKKTLLIIFILFVLTSYCFAQEGGKLSFQVTPGVNLPLGASKEMFTLGGGGEIAGQYSMPFSGLLFARGSLDYSLVPTLAENSLSMISFGAGAGISYDVIPKLNLSASFSGGYGLGIYSGQTGGSAYIAGEGGLVFFFAPAFGLGAGAGYRHYFSKPTPFYQALKLNLGTIIRLGAGSVKANIDIPEIRFEPVFPVFYKHYDDHPLGEAVILNTEKGPIKNLKVSFFVNQYMDGPKESTVVEEVKKGESVTVPLYALFTDNVLSITEGTKVSAVITAGYELGGREMLFEKTETIRLYDRNAMTWDDDRKAAAFVTAKDPEVLKFAKSIAGLVREHPNRAVNLNFRIGMGLFEGLGLHGVNYVIDPQTPYAEFSKDAASLDYLQFPVQTLSYKAGDCDDLSICYAAMLESTGIETAFITIPGHIFMAFSLGMDSEEAKKLFKNPGDLIYQGDFVWLPVEITMVQDGFLKAWEKGAKEWRENDIDGKAGFFPVHQAWQNYEPVGLSSSTDTVSGPGRRQIEERYGITVNRFVEREIAEQVARFEERIRTQGAEDRTVNKLGVLYARYGLMAKAKEQFKKAARGQYAPAMVNLGNILFLEKDYDGALNYFSKAEEQDPDSPKVLLGIAKANYELENQGTVKRTFEKLQQKDPDLAKRFSYLVSAADDAARASSAMIAETVVWDEED